MQRSRWLSFMSLVDKVLLCPISHTYNYAALSSCQLLGEYQDCVSGAEESQCSALYRDYTKPDCTGCPLIQLDECNQIVNCHNATDVEYAEAAFQFNTAQPQQPDPCTIVMADSPTCIRAAVRKIRELRDSSNSTLQFSIRSGRHSYIGASTVSKGVIVDVSRIKTFELNTDEDTVTMGVGNTLIEVYSKLWNLTTLPRSLFPGGTCPTVGLAGLILGGGQGIVGRRYGLASDNILEYRMVNATGDIMMINNITNSDLFWALRGGGNGNFGIVYEVILQRFDIPEQNTDIVHYYHNPGEWLTVFEAWQNLIRSEDFIGNETIWTQLTLTPTRLYVATHITGDSTQIAKSLNTINATVNLPNTNPSGPQPNTSYTMCNYTPQNYSGAMAFWAGCGNSSTCGTHQDFETCLQLATKCCGRPFNMNSGYQGPEPLSTLGMQTLIENVLSVESVTGCQKVQVQMDSLGGRINAVPSSETAFPHRNNTFGYQYITYFGEPCNQTAMIQWLDLLYANMTQHMGNGSYVNYANINITMPNERYFLGNLERLMEVKSMYDPENFFNYSQSIPPSTTTSAPSDNSSVQPFSWQYASYAFAIIIAVAMGTILTRPSSYL